MMNNRKIGAILVIDQKDPSRLLGIFTERDLLRQYETIKEGSNDLSPISRYMSPEIISLPVSQVNASAGVMLKQGIRHVVLTEDDDPTQKRLAGIISIRDVLAQLMSGLEGNVDPAAALPQDVLLFSAADDSRKMLRALLGRFPSVQLKTMDALDAAGLEMAAHARVVLVDLDRQAREAWSEFLRKLLGSPVKGRRLTVLYNPHAMRQQELAALQLLADGKHIDILEKPLSLGDLQSVVIG